MFSKINLVKLSRCLLIQILCFFAFVANALTISFGGGGGATIVDPIPSAPYISSATAGVNSATICFNVPSNDGTYYIQKNVSDPYTLSYRSYVQPGSCTTIYNLTAGQSYPFVITVTNGSRYNNSGYAYVTPYGTPSAPTNISATSGDKQATVYFTLPINSGVSNSSYIVTASPGGNSATGTSSPIVVSGLTNGTAYQFTVAGQNSGATSSASTASNSVIPKFTQTLSLPVGWSLLGNSMDSSIVVASNFSDATTYSAVWKWQSSTSRWAFYAPYIAGGTSLANYAAAQGYDVLTTINSGEGFWVNSKKATTLNFESINSVDNASLINPSKWTLLTVGQQITPAGLAATLSAKGNNVDSLLVWDSINSKWGFYSPTLDASGTLDTYANTNGFTNLGLRTVQPGEGIYIGSGTSNLAPPTAGQPAIYYPDSPTITSVQAGNSKAVISFSPPSSNGGAAVTGYVIKVSPSNTTVNVTSSPATVTGLSNGTSYNFSVAAKNSAGTGAYSSASDSVTPQQESSQVINFGSVPSLSYLGSATITATGGTSGNAVTLTSLTPSVCFISGVTVNAITAGTCIIAANQLGNLNYLSAAQVTQIISVPKVGQYISFVPVANLNYGASISLSATGGTSGNAVTFTSLTPNVCSVSNSTLNVIAGGSCTIAANQLGNANYDAANQVTQTINVALTVPGAPTSVNATPGNTSASVSFSAPTNSGGASITNYTVTASPGGRTATGTTSPINLTGLTNGISYTFTVTATNSVGNSLASQTSNSVTPKASLSIQLLSGWNLVANSLDAAIDASSVFSDSTKFSSIWKWVPTTSKWAVYAPSLSNVQLANYAINQGYEVLNSINPGEGFWVNALTANTLTTQGNASFNNNSIVTSSKWTLVGLGQEISPNNLSLLLSSSGNYVDSLWSWDAPSSKWMFYSTNLQLTGLLSSFIGSNGYLNLANLQPGEGVWVGVGTNSDRPPVAALNVITVPNAPNAPSVSAGNGQAVVSFNTPSSNGGSSITGYVVKVSPGNTTVTGTSSPITVSGLVNGSAYTFTVAAVNTAGTGAFSASSPSVTPIAPVSAPGAPTGVSATAGNASAVISFNAPSNNGGAAITSYTVTSSGGQTATGNSSPITVSGLTSGVQYTFTVTASNTAGPSSSSTSSNIAVYYANLPLTPSVSAVAGNASATLAITSSTSSCIAGGPPGAPISCYLVPAGAPSYTVTSSPGGITATSSSSPITITGLTNGTAYTFTAKMTTNTDTSASSAASNSVTPTAPATVPGVPTGISAVAGNASATISFSPPSSNGGATITSYRVTSSPGGFYATGSGSPITVTGLTNGAAYSFTVVAINSAGSSANSAPSNSVTPTLPVAVPGSPTGVSATPGNASATVSFTAPSNNGGASITGYTVTSIPGGKSAFGTSSPITVSGLTNGTAYAFTVTATNSAGTGTASSASNSVTPTLPSTTISIVAGWNLIGNSYNTPIDVTSLLSDTSKITTVWKWLADKTRWAFYAPTLSSQALSDYVSTNGYDALSTIVGGEGFWVNAKQSFDLQMPNGVQILATDFQSGGAQQLKSGWSLIAMGDSKSPSNFNSSLSLTPPSSGTTISNITSLWAWQADGSKWYFYAPSLDASGQLINYTQNNGYLDFSTSQKTLTPGVGFWINKP